MQQSRFDPEHPDYEGGEPTAMPPISDPNHPDHAKWSEEHVYGATPTVVTEAPPVETETPAPAKRTRTRSAKKATKKAAAKKAAAKK